MRIEKNEVTIRKYLEKVLDDNRDKKIDNNELNEILSPLFRNISDKRYSFNKKSRLLDRMFEDFNVPAIVVCFDEHIVLLYPETNSIKDYDGLIEESKKWKQ